MAKTARYYKSILRVYCRNVFANYVALFCLLFIVTVYVYQTFDRDVGEVPRMAESRYAKMDWHNYEFIVRDQERVGMGENGKAEKLDTPVKPIYKNGVFRGYEYNQLLSDAISVNRSILDSRLDACWVTEYYMELPKVSVIIPVVREEMSVLLRMVHSVVNRTPVTLLAEIILIIDSALKKKFRDELELYTIKHFAPLLVKIIPIETEQGIGFARTHGAKAAIGEVLIFLDSHIEAGYNWLPPLLEPIVDDYKTCISPVFDLIDMVTFEYKPETNIMRGGFDWNLRYRPLPQLTENLKNSHQSFETPVLTSNMFAISAKFFREIGGYDVGPEFEGGEQFEMSFKVWLCGGKILINPCSRLGHLDQDLNADHTKLNAHLKRIAEIWLDEYRETVFARNQIRWSNTDPTTNIKIQLSSRRKCKPFQHFIERAAFDLLHHFPLKDPPHHVSGAIRSISNPELCLDTMNHEPGEELGIYNCEEGNDRQRFSLNSRNFIESVQLVCLEIQLTSENSPVLVADCKDNLIRQQWKYTPVNKTLVGVRNRCLEFDPGARTVFANQCTDDNERMRWEWV